MLNNLYLITFISSLLFQRYRDLVRDLVTPVAGLAQGRYPPFGTGAEVYLSCEVGIVAARHVAEHPAFTLDTNRLRIVRIGWVAGQRQPVSGLHALPQVFTVVVDEAGERGMLDDDAHRCAVRGVRGQR